MYFRIFIIIYILPKIAFAVVGCPVGDNFIFDPALPPRIAENPAAIGAVKNPVGFRYGGSFSTLESLPYESEFWRFSIDYKARQKEAEAFAYNAGLEDKDISASVSYYTGSLTSIDNDTVSLGTKNGSTYLDYNNRLWTVSFLNKLFNIGQSFYNENKKKDNETFEIKSETVGFQLNIPFLFETLISYGRSRTNENYNNLTKSIQANRNTYASGTCLVWPFVKEEGGHIIAIIEKYYINKPNYTNQNFGREITEGRYFTYIFEWYKIFLIKYGLQIEDIIYKELPMVNGNYLFEDEETLYKRHAIKQSIGMTLMDLYSFYYSTYNNSLYQGRVKDYTIKQYVVTLNLAPLIFDK